VAEESGLLGAKALSAKKIKADFGIALDGGGASEIVYKAPSQKNFEVEVFGKAAHAGIHPEEGINAIQVASVAIACLKIGRIDAETTTNIGVIKGGKATNIVPEEVEIKCEARSHNIKKLDREVAKMERALVRACEEFGARLQLKTERVYNSFEINRKTAIFTSLQAAMRSFCINPKTKRTGGGSDANIFNERGIPTLIVGVGADHVHTTREQVKADDLCQGTEIVLKTIIGMGQWKNLQKKK
jgi:tripeptide aminopeptidase